jgi:hypothetical protein
MTKFEGQCFIDSIELVELIIDPVGSSPKLLAKKVVAKYALANKETGVLFGSGTFFEWSDTVKEKINELMKLMEADIGVRIFKTIEKETPSSSVEYDDHPLEDDVPGL